MQLSSNTQKHNLHPRTHTHTQIYAIKLSLRLAGSACVTCLTMIDRVDATLSRKFSATKGTRTLIAICPNRVNNYIPRFPYRRSLEMTAGACISLNIIKSCFVLPADGYRQMYTEVRR